MKLHRIVPLFALVGLVLAAPARAQEEAETAAPAAAAADAAPADEAAPAEAEATPATEGETEAAPAAEGEAAPVEGEQPATAAEVETPESAPAEEPTPESAPAPEPEPEPAPEPAAAPVEAAPLEEPVTEAEADWTWMSVAGWSLLGVGTVSTVVGAVVLSNPGDELQMPLGLGAFGTGALLGVAGAVLLYLDTSE